MRVISGTARRILLKTVEGNQTRPTTDRIKETLFNMIAPGLPGGRFLDLFSGSGAIGIEALSRGADCAYFVENQPKALRCIEENLAATKLADRARVFQQDVPMAISTIEREGQSFDLIFIDPPYQSGYEVRVLKALSASALVDEDTLIIVEADIKTDFTFAGEMGFEVYKVKEYKTNKHVFLFLAKNIQEDEEVPI